MTNPEYQSLLRAVLADPQDDTPRLVLADWLEENGHGPRAEFIRVQCQMAKRRAGPAGPVPEDSPWLAGDSAYQRLRRRKRELLEEWSSKWVYQLLGTRLVTDVDGATVYVEMNGPVALNCYQTFRRGFVAAVTLSAEDWLRHADALTEQQPIEEVTLTTTLGVVRARLLSANWPRIMFSLPTDTP